MKRAVFHRTTLSLTPALSRWERGPTGPRWTTRRGWLAVAVNPWLPLPAGEGRGEGERTVVAAQALTDSEGSPKAT